MKRILSLIILAILIVGCSRNPEESCMAVEFDLSNYITYEGITIPNGDMTICVWIYPHRFGSGDGYGDGITRILNGAENKNRIWLEVYDYSIWNDAIYFANMSGSADGYWYAEDILTINTWQHVCVTYNNSDRTNVPTIYLDGAEQSITTSALNTSIETVDNPMRLEVATTGGDYKFDGLIQDLRYYNRILSQTEISTLYNSRCQRVVMNGLVFWAPMDGAKGLSAFDGVALGADNTILDYVSGAEGVPYYSPIGRGNTIQRIY